MSKNGSTGQASTKLRPPKLDYGDAFADVTKQAEHQAESRFARAERITEVMPTGLSTRIEEGAQAAPLASRSAHDGAFDVRALVVGETYDVPVALVDPNPYSPRFFYKSAQVDKTAMSMDQKGQKVAANGFVNESGRVQLIEGGTRLRSARAIGAPTLEIKIEEPPKDELDMYNRAVEFHDERTNHTALDTAMLMRRLLEDGVCKDQDELTAKIKVNGTSPSKSLVSMYLRVSRNIPDRLLVQMADHEVTSALRVAYAVSALFVASDYEKDKDRYEALAEEVIQEVITKSMGAKDVEALVQSKLTGPKARQRGESTNVKFGEAKGVIKLFEQRGQLDFSIKGVPPDKLTALKATLEAICAGRTPLAEAG